MTAAPLPAARVLRGLLTLVTLTGCEATFTDLRPEGAGLSGLPGPDAMSRDAGPRDAAPLDLDATSGPDAATPDAAAGNPATVLARGTWVGRADYRASGSVELIRRADGALELRLGADFSVSGVPGPVVVLSRREALGRRLDPSQDLELGPLTANAGAQTYAAPAGADDRGFAWVFCKPFGLEVGRAELVGVR